MPIIIRPTGDADLANAVLHDETALPQTISGLAAGDWDVGRIEWALTPVTVTEAAAETAPVTDPGPGTDPVTSTPSSPTLSTLTPIAGGFDYVLVPPVDDGGDPITGYRLYSGGAGSEVLIGSGPGLTGSVTGLDAVPIRVTARAINAQGSGDFSNALSVTPLEVTFDLTILRDGISFTVSGSRYSDLELDLDADGLTDYAVPATTLQATLGAPQFVGWPSLSLTEQTLTIDPGVVIHDADASGLTVTWELRRPDTALVAFGSGTATATYTTTAGDEGELLTLTVSLDDDLAGGPTTAMASQTIPAFSGSITDDFDGYAVGTKLKDTASWAQVAALTTVSAGNEAFITAGGELRYAPGEAANEALAYTPPGGPLTDDRRVGIYYVGNGNDGESSRFARLYLNRDDVSGDNVRLEIHGSQGLELRESGTAGQTVKIQNGASPTGRYTLERVGDLVTAYLDSVEIGSLTMDAATARTGPALIRFTQYGGAPSATFDDFIAESI